ncbi:tetratricopeptide repeat protein [Clostridium sp. KNHs214]|uniref:tetratricopeptide repeat protein n=1 Tax=Clostridium sp. KNHs214 TaxID=1540257 RepID=UPI000554B510|nr:tetratricopeptide repeat protein [Clostridium sp. KNHs214]
MEIPEISEAIELNQQGSMLLAKEKYQEALKYFEKAREIDPMEVETYFNLGNLYANMEQYEKAEEQFKKIILIDKKNGLVYFNLGNISFLRDNIEKGVEYYNKAVANGYEEANLYYNLGMVYEETDNFLFAVRNYSKAIAKEPLNPEYRLKQISLYIKNDKLDEALEALEELNQYCPDIFEGYHFRFEIYCAQGKFEEAEKVINGAIELFPKDVSLFYNKIRLINIQGDYENALTMIEEAEKMEGFEVEARNLDFERAKIYAQKEDVESTINYLEKCINYEDGEIDYEVRYFIMNAYLAANNYEKVLENAEVLAKEEDGESSYIMSAIYYRALSLKMLGREEEAKKHYKEACKLFRAITISSPNNLDAYMFRILCHKDLKEYAKALELLDYVLLLKEDSGEVYAIKASIYKEMGDEKKAEENMEIAKKYNSVFDMNFN